MKWLLVPIAAVLLVAGASGAHANLTVTVTDVDTRNGIQADIYLITVGPPPKDEDIATSDAKTGVAVIQAVTCVPGDEIHVDPIDSDYAPASPKACNGATVNIVLRKQTQVEAIRTLAVSYAKAGEAGRAAQAFNEAYVSQPSRTNPAEVYKAVGVALHLDRPAVTFDPAQGKVVASPALVKKVIEFQKSRNLTPDGIIGPKTLETLAHGTVNSNVLQKINAQ